MSEAFIIDAVRTPTGRRNGRLSEVHPADLGAHAIGNLIERSGVDPEQAAAGGDTTGGEGWG